MPRTLLVGSPNSGKSLLFNRLTGLSQKVANFPGITIDVGSGPLSAMPEMQLVDFPGTYSLHAISAEERVAVDQFERALADDEVAHVLCVIDATRLEKSLYFTLQVIRDCQRNGKPVTVLANMTDVLERHGLEFDAQGLSKAINAPVLSISGRTGKRRGRYFGRRCAPLSRPRAIQVTTWSTVQMKSCAALRTSCPSVSVRAAMSWCVRRPGWTTSSYTR